MTDAKTYTFHITKEELPSLAIDYIAERTDISKVKIKDAMNKGAVWLKPAQGARKTKLKEKRLRRSKYQLISGQILSVYFDSKILSELTSEAELIHAIEEELTQFCEFQCTFNRFDKSWEYYIRCSVQYPHSTTPRKRTKLDALYVSIYTLITEGV